MSTISTYKDLIVWQKSMNLVKEIYLLAKSFPKTEEYGLSSQIKRSAISVPSNIAEGWGRNSSKSYTHFLKIARGSLFELETQLLIAKDLQFINDISTTNGLIIEIGKMLNSLIKTIEKKEERNMV